MRYLKKLLILSTFFVFTLPSISKAEQDITYVDSLDIRTYIYTPVDTVWFVNYKFNKSLRDKVELKLKFTNYEGYDLSGATCTYNKINIQDGTDEGGASSVSVPSDLSSNLLVFPELNEGVYRIKFDFPNESGGKQINAYLFNKDLDFEIDTVKFSTDVCISNGADTCIFALKNHRFNPKDTKYKMSPMKDFGEDIKVDEEKVNNAQDTFYVIFNGPTGVDPMLFSVTGIYLNPRNKQTNQYTRAWEYSVRKFDRPNLPKMFSFDTLSIEHVLGCTEVPLSGLSYNEDENRRYMDDVRRPDFETKTNYQIEYFRKEKLDDADWIKIGNGEKLDYLTDSLCFTFMKSGLYRIKMKAENMCGQDSLDTKEIFDKETGTLLSDERLIKVYGSDLKNVEFNKSLLCLHGENMADTLVIKDTAKVLMWEGIPEYSLSVGTVLKDQAGNDSIVEVKEEDGVYKEFILQTFASSGGDGYDSVKLQVAFYNPGIYDVTVSKQSQGGCAVVSNTLRLKVGKLPELAAQILEDADNRPMVKERICGVYKYAVPKELEIDSMFCNLEEYEWKFGKGTYVERFNLKHPADTVVFDSLKGDLTPSYITLKVRNECGWSEMDSLSFFTFAMPKVELWRDSIPGNDTLCAGRDYNYHFKGVFPADFTIKGYAANDSVIQVRQEIGDIEERFIISNNDEPGCNQVIDGEVHVIKAPVFEVLDTLHFCKGSITEIKTADLLTTAWADKEYRTLKWKLTRPDDKDVTENSDPGLKDFPTVSLFQEEMALQYYVSTGGDSKGDGGGCYTSGEIALYEHPKPVMVLIDPTGYSCDGEALNVGGHIQKLENESDLAIEINGELWYSKTDAGGTGIKEYKCPVDKDSVVIKYNAVQSHNYPGVEGCSLSDSVKVYVSHPKIHFAKMDTVFAHDFIYDFQRIEPFTDTAKVKELKWEVVKNGVASELSGTGGLFDYKYDFQANGISPNTILSFVLKGNTLCDKAIYDTLKVFYPQQGLIAGQLDLCSNVENYSCALWSDIPDENKVYGYYVDKSTLKWEIDETGKQGHIEGTGADAKYMAPVKPAGGTVTIHISGKDVWGVPLTGVDFKIVFHQAPYLDLAQTGPYTLVGNDTLIVKEALQIQRASSCFWRKLGDGEVINANSQDDARYVPAYDRHFSAYRDSVYVMMGVEQSSRAFCGSFINDTLFMTVYPEPGVSIDKDTLEMCEGDRLKIGGDGEAGVLVDADADAAISWTAKSGCISCLIPDPMKNQVVEYTPAGHGYETVYLKVKKEVVNYRGENKKLFGADSLVVKTYGEPHFAISRKRDTICFNTSAVDLSDVVIGSPEGYDLVIEPQRGLQFQAAMQYELLPGYDSVNIYITAKVDKCSKWSHVKDSVVVMRLPELEASFVENFATICSNTELPVQVETNTSKFTWQTAYGGTLTRENGIAPVYHPVDGVLHDEVIFKALPLLDKCTDFKEVRAIISVVPQPVFAWADDTVCSSRETFALGCGQADMIQSIKWTSSSAGQFLNGENNIPEPVYQISEVDRINGEVTLSAEILLKSPCQGEGTLKKSMKLTILPEPSMSIDPAVRLSICQGDSLDLDFITYKDCSAWQWTTSRGRLNESTVAAPRFYSDEISGTAELSVVLTGTTAGTHTCVSDPQLLQVEVLAAPKPDIVVSSTACQSAEVKYTTQVAAEEYVWKKAGMEDWKQKDFVYSFDKEGDYAVELEVKYANACRRSESNSIRVFPKPVSRFKADSSIVGVKKMIHFENQSEDIEHQWWYVADLNVADDFHMDYEFSSSGLYRVGLEVENSQGCRDTAYADIRAIIKPIARFTVALENPGKPCDGSLALFENLSQGDKAYLSYRWILNTSRPGVDTTAEIPSGADVRYYASSHQDTVYRVGLIVENAAGADTAYQDVKIVSHMKARLELVNGSVSCAGFEKIFLNCTAGTADWYKIDWGDGSDTTFTERSAQLTIKHKYSNETYEARQHTVKLCAGNVCEEDCTEIPVSISPNSAVAKIRIDEKIGGEGCYMFEAKLHNISTGFGGVKKALWNFGEGEPWVEDLSEVVSNLYEKPGKYKVVLKVFDACNVSVDSVPILVKGNDRLSFTVKENNYCSGQTLTMEVDPEIKGQFYDYSWNFYDGSPESAWVEKNKLEVEHTWPAGTYRVALKAKSLDGCEVYEPYFKVLKVNETPLADLQFRYAGEKDYRNRNEVIEGCNPLYVEFKSIGAREKDVVLWDFRDGGISQENSLAHQFTVPGKSEIKLKVASENGCVDSLMKDVLVKVSPEVDFQNRAGNLFCDNGLVYLDVENTSLSKENTTFLWTYRRPDDAEDVFWDDKAEPAGKDLESVYGDVVIKVKATDQTSGCFVEKTDILISSPAISTNFKIDNPQVCEGEEIRFQFFANEGDEVNWNLGDNSPDLQEEDFTYLYGQAGEYKVNLDIQNKYGCRHDTICTIRVYPLPQADFTYAEDHSVIENLPDDIDVSKLPEVPTGGFSFTNLSHVTALSFTTGDLNSSWDFGDQTALVYSENPSHHFNNNGQYEVKLLVRADHGCADSISQFISVDAVKGLYIPNAFAPGAGIEENPGVALFQPKGIGLLSYKIRIYDGDTGTCVWMSDKLIDGRPAEAWDGTFNGQPLPKKAYEWNVSAIFIDGTVWKGEDGHTKGIVVLVR